MVYPPLSGFVVVDKTNPPPPAASRTYTRPQAKTPPPWTTRASSAISLAIRLRRRKVSSPCSRIQPPSATARRALLSQRGAGRSLAQKVRRTAACWSASPPAQVGDISHNKMSTPIMGTPPCSRYSTIRRLRGFRLQHWLPARRCSACVAPATGQFLWGVGPCDAGCSMWDRDSTDFSSGAATIPPPPSAGCIIAMGSVRSTR